MGRTGRVARGLAAPGPFPRRHRSERSFSAAVCRGADLGHAAAGRCPVLSALFPNARTCRGRTGARSARNLRQGLFAFSGDVPGRGPGKGDVAMVPRNSGFLSGLPSPGRLAGMDRRRRTLIFTPANSPAPAFAAASNWYRNIDRNWELLAPFAGAKVNVPALYIAGDRDLVVAFRGMDQLIPNLKNYVPQLRTRSCCRVAVTGPSRSAPRRSAPR